MKHLVIEMHIEKRITPIFTHQAFFILKIRLGYSPKFSFLTRSTQQEMLRFSSIGGAWNISPWTEGARGSALATHSLISSEWTELPYWLRRSHVGTVRHLSDVVVES